MIAVTRDTGTDIISDTFKSVTQFQDTNKEKNERRVGQVYHQLTLRYTFLSAIKISCSYFDSWDIRQRRCKRAIGIGSQRSRSTGSRMHYPGRCLRTVCSPPGPFSWKGIGWRKQRSLVAGIHPACGAGSCRWERGTSSMKPSCWCFWQTRRQMAPRRYCSPRTPPWSPLCRSSCRTPLQHDPPPSFWRKRRRVSCITRIKALSII